MKTFYEANTVQYKEGADEYYSANDIYAPFGRTQYPSQRLSQKEKRQSNVLLKNNFYDETAFNEPQENYFDMSQKFHKNVQQGKPTRNSKGGAHTEPFHNDVFSESNLPSFKENDLTNPSFDIASFRPSSFATF